MNLVGRAEPAAARARLKPCRKVDLQRRAPRPRRGGTRTSGGSSRTHRSTLNLTARVKPQPSPSCAHWAPPSSSEGDHADGSANRPEQSDSCTDVRLPNNAALGRSRRCVPRQHRDVSAPLGSRRGLA